MVIALTTTPSNQFSCAFKVNCDQSDYENLKVKFFLNYILMDVEQAGGVWDGGQNESTVFNPTWKLIMLSTFLIMSMIHVWLKNFNFYKLLGRARTEKTEETDLDEETTASDTWTDFKQEPSSAGKALNSESIV